MTQKIAIWAPSHNFARLYLRNWGMYRQSEKNLLSSNICSTCPYNMVNFGPLTAEIGWRVWGTPSYFNRYRVLAALLHGSQVVSVSQTLRVEQRAPPMFGKATIRLGIGPHSSLNCSVLPIQTMLVPKLVAMATFIRTSKLAMSSSDSLTPKTHP